MKLTISRSMNLAILLMMVISISQNAKCQEPRYNSKIYPSNTIIDYHNNKNSIEKKDNNFDIIESRLSQKSNWIVSLLTNQNAVGTSFKQGYDFGYIVTGWLGNNYYPFSFLVKTDVNGIELWHKTLTVEGITGFVTNSISQAPDGSIYISGGMDADINQNPFLLKLNACGEREWVKRFTDEHFYTWAWHVLAEADGGCTVMILNQNDYPGFTNRIQLVRFSADGQMLWNQFLLNDDSLAKGSVIESLVQAQDLNYWLCGDIYYASPINPNYHYLHPYIINANPNGSIISQFILAKQTDNGGRVFSLLQNDDHPFIYLFGTKTTVVNWPGGLLNHPSLYKLTQYGDTVGHYKILKDTVGYVRDAVYADNDQFIVSGELKVGGPWYYQFLMKTDTLGKLINIRKVVEDLYPMHLIKTFDGKILCLVLTSSHTIPSDMNTHLYKYNQDLEFDTLNPFPFVYDSLCPYAIGTDTVWCNNPDIIGIEDLQPVISRNIRVYPNPASGRITVQLPTYSVTTQSGPVFNSTLVQYNQAIKKGKLEVFDAFGRKVMEIPTPAGQEEIPLDISNLHSGLYLLRYSTANTWKGSGKMVVE